ncbi:MAG: hypothetical protein PHG03_00025 [Bacilli bacterium]|nr:hypothetical protein [Bacilli bacterium]MDD4794943.1 hypothetical protein [Bacilli bacterium]
MEYIDIKLPSGEVINVELISYFKIISTGKNYLFYTKNEVVENNLIKMYVTEIIPAGTVFNVSDKMSDEEWTGLKNIMKSILTGSNNEDIIYLEIGES